MRHSIFSYTYSQYCDRFFKGKLLAGELYRQWFKKGSLDLTVAQMVQAKNLVASICEATDWTLPERSLFHQENETCKFLLKTPDGYDVESVRIPMKTQETLCVSSQVGCRMGCTFCETGRMGLLRNLTAGEVVSQVYVARFIYNFPIRNVVFMGMGEPFDNYDEVMQACRVLTDQNGLAFGMHRLTVSTSGKIEGILKLADDPEVGPNLAVSLNAPNDVLRSKLMPHNRKENMQELREAIHYYCQKRARQVLVAYVLLAGVNDSLEHADELARYLEGLDIKVNLIPYNAQTVDRFQPPDNQVVDAFAARLRNRGSSLGSRGFRVLLRHTKGRSIMAACGQLGNPAKRSRSNLVLKIGTGIE